MILSKIYFHYLNYYSVDRCVVEEKSSANNSSAIEWNQHTFLGMQDVLFQKNVREVYPMPRFIKPDENSLINISSILKTKFYRLYINQRIFDRLN